MSFDSGTSSLNPVDEMGEARSLLAKMKLAERAAVNAERYASRDDYSGRWYAEQYRHSYREMIGVDPDRRESLRRSLEQIVDAGALKIRTRIHDVIATVNGVLD